jgi:4-diphosphocytidyl-2-C-methyl-D-erythritol kinase
MRYRSFAKINLGIEVLGKRDDGYHEIRTLFQTVSLFDQLTFFPRARNEIILKGDDKTIPWNGANLIHKAAVLLKQRHGIETGVEIHVTKKIPAGKGLGGGSSNAAITLLALNQLWRLQLEKEAFRDLGVLLGADVPFFFEGGLCLGQGIGEDLDVLEDLDPCFCVLAFPSFSISTASAYNGFSASLTSQDKDSKIIKFLDSRDLGFLENDLEEIAFRTHPQIKAIKNLIQKQGSELCLMSGSGSAVFGLFRQKEMAEKTRRMLEREQSAVVVTTLSRADYWRELRTGV